MKRLLCSAVLITSLLQVKAQKIVGGEWSAGARLGGSAGLSLKKHSGSNTSAFELIAANSFDSKVDGFTLTAMFEKLSPMNGNGQLSALFGAGVNLNFKETTKVGVSGIIGFDWRLKNVPITMQIDWLPTWFLINENYFSGVNGAFTIRYVLNRKKFDRN